MCLIWQAGTQSGHVHIPPCFPSMSSQNRGPARACLLCGSGHSLLVVAHCIQVGSLGKCDHSRIVAECGAVISSRMNVCTIINKGPVVCTRVLIDVCQSHAL